MILGMTPLVFVHVLISFIGIFSGAYVAWAMLRADPVPKWTAVFLWSTLLTSLSGFILPADKFLPSHATGIVSVLVLAFTFYAWYAKKLEGRWRSIYAGTAIAALYLNVFVLVVQAFLKVPGLHALAPKQSEPPFAITQGAVLIGFILLGILATRRFRGAPSGEHDPAIARK